MTKKTTDSKKKPFLVQIREAIKSLDATTKAIRKSEFKIADFQSPLDNPAERIKREYITEMNRQFDELFKQTREYNLRLFGKFVECSQALSRIPNLAIDATKVRTDDTRTPSNIEVYTHCFQMRGKVPVEVVLKVRGWGFLTGYKKLPSNTAAEIQDEFGKFVIECIKAATEPNDKE